MSALPPPFRRRGPLASAVLAALCLGGQGCVSTGFAQASATDLPCEAESIEISRVEGSRTSDGVLSWVATCNERRWLCSRIHERALCDEIPADFEFGEPAADG